MRFTALLAIPLLVVAVQGANQIDRPTFWGTGLNEDGTTRPQLYDELHWTSSVAPSVYREPAWFDPGFDIPARLGDWIARYTSSPFEDEGEFPYYLTFSLENNFYTDFTLDFDAGADNNAYMYQNGDDSDPVEMIHNVQDDRYSSLGNYEFVGGWNENVNTITVVVENTEAAGDNPSGIYFDFDEPTLYPRPDIVWRDYIRGYNDVWYCDSANYKASGSLPAETTTAWVIIGTGNFSGTDPYIDLFWRHGVNGTCRIWRTQPALEGQNVTTTTHTVSGTLTSINLFGVGDFNEDGMSDILARGGDYVQSCPLTESSGSYTLSTQPTISTEYDSNWVIQGVGHFKQSEEDPRLKRDIVWRNTSTGANRVWIIESGSVASVHSLPSESTSSGWVMAAFTKFDEDNVCDIIWTNSSGQVRVWTLNSDFTLKGTITGLPTVVPQSWHGWQIVGPR